MKLRKIAIDIIMYHLEEAWHEVDCPYYSQLPATEREEIRSYIHHYGHQIGQMLRRRYRPH